MPRRRSLSSFSRRVRWSSPFLLIVLLLFVYSIASSLVLVGVVVAADDGGRGVDGEYDEYVKEVLQEDQQENENHGHGDDNNNYYYEDSHYEKIETEQRLEKERIAQEQADRIRADRERAFQAELDKMNADQQAAALKQKKLDAKVVNSVLKALKRNELYQVLGIRNWNWKIPAREWNVVGFSIALPGITVKETTMKDIRRAYRTRAMLVHPDKNKDGRAQQAFIAVEETASILSDQRLRAEYDLQLQAVRRERRRLQMALVSDVTDTVLGTTMGTLKAAHKLLGPFATPVIILGALIA